MRLRIFLLATAALCQSPDLDRLAGRYFDEYLFHFNPTQATISGFHQYDTQLEDLSKPAIQNRITMLHRFDDELAKLPPSSDRDLLVSSVRAGLLDLETIRMWQRNPDLYS